MLKELKEAALLNRTKELCEKLDCVESLPTAAEVLLELAKIKEQILELKIEAANGSN